MKKVLFVCLGNICRSPVAEGVFNHQIRNLKLTGALQSDSAGTAGYHIGEKPHTTSASVAASYGVTLNHRARQFSRTDFADFDIIVCMDRGNYTHILREAATPEEKAKVFLMRQWESGPEPCDVKNAEEVPDPYYGGVDGFHLVHQILETCNRNLISWLSR